MASFKWLSGCAHMASTVLDWVLTPPGLPIRVTLGFCAEAIAYVQTHMEHAPGSCSPQSSEILSVIMRAPILSHPFSSA